ncbi:hypothetical protein JKA74_04255 [Marivirga sp. S37H4]|uniref:Uncharacterized protein n=1 Tax=Marivirga aurantiaca TaxID=2802615 RepID=A0A935C9G2_9BACT|nr:hypothetical protein [Marivirga aurantiaca]MBK6264238.1 hypothetical protein [Marivirga aurantiaca]
MKSIIFGVAILIIGMISKYIIKERSKEVNYSLYDKTYYDKQIYGLIIGGIMGIVVGILQILEVI